jgi:hypothetical protein
MDNKYKNDKFTVLKYKSMFKNYMLNNYASEKYNPYFWIVQPTMYDSSYGFIVDAYPSYGIPSKKEKPKVPIKQIPKIKKSDFNTTVNIKDFVEKYNEIVKQLYDTYTRVGEIFKDVLKVEYNRITFAPIVWDHYNLEYDEYLSQFIDEKIRELNASITNLNELIQIIT